MDMFIWTVVAFLGGGAVGVFLLSLMRFAAEAPRPRAVSLAKRPRPHP